ncbi:hypothetical protein GQ457_07G021370 [Hibiscus cannabinus]
MLPQAQGETLLNYKNQTLDLEATTLCFPSAMKLFHRFRKSLIRFLFSSSGSSAKSSTASSKQNNSVRFDPPKISCSSYYSSHSHYSEAIADCIDLFNKSSQGGPKYDVSV